MFQKQQKWSPPGQSAYTSVFNASKLMPNVSALSSSATTSDEVHHQANYRDYQQNVNQPAG
jgi:hypothetical protein